MKEEIIKKLKSKYDALSLLEINDLLGLESPEELKELELTLEELVKEYVIYKTKKDKYRNSWRFKSIIKYLRRVGKRIYCL